MIIDYQGINIEINKIVLRLFTIDARKAVITLKKVASHHPRRNDHCSHIIFSLQNLKKYAPDVSSGCDPPPKIAEASPKF